MNKKPTNTQKTGKRGGKTKTSWKPGQSGNPNGPPARGESWQELYKKIGNMTPREAAEYCHSVAGKIGSIGDKVTLKEAVVLRVFVALIFEPDARLLSVVQDRGEGKVTQPVTEIPWREYVRQAGYDPDRLLKEAEEIVNNRFAELGDSANHSRSDRAQEPHADRVAD